MADLPGYISDTELYYETAGGGSPEPEPPEPRVDNSVPCCGGTSPSGETLGPDPTFTPIWTPECAGGGVAPDGTDVVNSENWSIV